MSAYSKEFIGLGMIPFLALVCWAIGFAAPAAAQDREPSDDDIPVDDYASRAKTFVHKLYPDLDPHLGAYFTDESHWGDRGGMDSFILAVGNYPTQQASTGCNPCPCMKVAFEGEFRFADMNDKALIWFSAPTPVKGPSHKFAELVRANPQWSDEQITQALKGTAAKYGPENKGQFLSALPLKELKPYIGEAKVDSAKFYAMRPLTAREGIDSVDSADFPICYWHVEVTCHFPSGEAKHYVLTFEAFEGRLFHMFWTGK